MKVHPIVRLTDDGPDYGSWPRPGDDIGFGNPTEGTTASPRRSPPRCSIRSSGSPIFASMSV